MDFIKNNLFYVIVAAAVIAIAVPSFLLARAKDGVYKRSLSDANTILGRMESGVTSLENVSENALAEAQAYQQGWKEQLEQARGLMIEKDKHLDEDFLIPVSRPGETPPAEEYKIAYEKAYGDIGERLARTKLTPSSALKDVLPSRANFGEAFPTPDQIRLTQKQYWMVKEIVDVLAKPELSVRNLSKIELSYVPNVTGETNHPDPTGTLWVYPVTLTFEMDFRNFPILLQELINNGNVIFYPTGYKIARAFDESTPQYVPWVKVVMGVEIWEYISTPFDKANLETFKKAAGNPS